MILTETSLLTDILQFSQLQPNKPGSQYDDRVSYRIVTYRHFTRTANSLQLFTIYRPKRTLP